MSPWQTRDLTRAPLPTRAPNQGLMQGAKLQNVERMVLQQSQPSHPMDAETGRQEQNEYFPAYTYTPS